MTLTENEWKQSHVCSVNQERTLSDAIKQKDIPIQIFTSTHGHTLLALKLQK